MPLNTANRNNNQSSTAQQYGANAATYMSSHATNNRELASSNSGFLAKTTNAAQSKSGSGKAVS